MRILVLTDRDQGFGRLLASSLYEAGAQTVLAGPGATRDGELGLPPQRRLRDVLRSTACGDIDAMLILECGGRILCPTDLASLPVPTLFYGIDTHLRHREHLLIAKLCDGACLAQRTYVAAFQTNGVQTEWVPLAANPSVHRPVSAVPTHQIAFVGNVNPKLHAERAKLLCKLQRSYSVLVTRADYVDAAAAMSLGVIAFNRSMAGELNLRVFETLACGRCLITDRAPGSGLEDLFRDGVHLALYDDDNLEAVADSLLSQPELIDQLAIRGHAEVMVRHTWSHRARQLLDVLETLQMGSRRGLGATVQVTSCLSWRRGCDFLSHHRRRMANRH